MRVKTITWKNGAIRIVDQTKLPGRLVYKDCRTPEEVWRAIKRLEVRGAPAIGIAGAMGVVLGIRDSRARTFDRFFAELRKVADYLGSSRPTAVNLFWALRRMTETAARNRTGDIAALKTLLEREALRILEEDNDICRRIGAHGAALIANGARILTHCNAGGLATAEHGTALAVIFAAHDAGKKISVFADETRPLLQGARLTAWELVRAGIDTTLICDSMAARVMFEGRVDLVITGADRIAANGDTANKIGTYGLARLAEAHRIPLYIAAPLSTVDLTLRTGRGIPIEQRHPDEVRVIGGTRVAPSDVKVYNPAFDVTPARFIAGIITETGVVRAPYRANLRAAFGKAGVKPKPRR